MGRPTYQQGLDALGNPAVPLADAVRLASRAYRRASPATRALMFSVGAGIRAERERQVDAARWEDDGGRCRRAFETEEK